MTMHRYRVQYRDSNDPGCPTFTTTMRGADRLHIEERFYDRNDGDDGWEIVTIKRID